MISAVSNGPNFTGIVPIRVFVNGQEKCDEKIIRSATRKLTSALIKPEENTELAELYSKFDSQYRKKGYPEGAKPSDFFRLIIDKSQGAFLATGPQARRLNELGKDIGKERGLCNERGTKNSLDLIVSKMKYFDAIVSMLKSVNLRLAQITDKFRFVTLNLDVQGKKLERVFFTT